METIIEETELDLQTPTSTTMKTEKPEKKKKNNLTTAKKEEVEEKREQLSILAVLGTIETYTGVNMSLGDVKKLSPKDVEKYHNRYQLTMGNQVTGGLVDMALEASTSVISYVLPIDDQKALCEDLKKNDLVKQELNNVAGYAVLHGGRFVALASGLMQVLKHVKFSPEQPLKQSSAAVEQSSSSC